MLHQNKHIYAKKPPQAKKLGTLILRRKKKSSAILLSIIETSCSLFCSCQNILSLTKTTMQQYFSSNPSLKRIKHKIKKQNLVFTASKPIDIIDINIAYWIFKFTLADTVCKVKFKVEMEGPFLQSLSISFYSHFPKTYINKIILLNAAIFGI